ncbi:unnamed protein product [Sympodiomycopsis kandeliae]
MSNPSQGYKLPESVPGAGASGISGQNTNQEALAAGHGNQKTVQEEMGASLGGNYSLGSVQAETKGEENLVPNPERNNPELTTAGRGGDFVRDELRSKDIDMPANQPHLQAQGNDSFKPPNGPSN